MDSLRALDMDARSKRVERNIDLIVTALDRSGFSADSESVTFYVV
jgi:hypothetical protein